MFARQAVIHLDNLSHNLSVIRKIAPGVPLCLAVKANGYGHGAVQIAHAAIEAGVEALGVATVDEAIELRNGGVITRIILYGISSTDEYFQMASWDIEGFAVSLAHVEGLAKAAETAGKAIGLHLKVDTGMGRIGCTPDEAPIIAEAIYRNPWLELRGLCTHFPVAEDARDFTLGQVRTLVALAETLRHKGIDPGTLHAANSAGLCLEEQSRLGMLRPGLIAYGYAPTPDSPQAATLRPVMELCSTLRFIKRVRAGTSISYGLRWTATRDTWIGTMPLGYADGLPRRASGKIHVMIGGRLYPQVGTICMDQCMIDLGSDTPPPIGSVVTVFGPTAPEMATLHSREVSKEVSAGSEQTVPTAIDVADAVGTIPYEILCGISPRVPRTYRH